MEYVRIYAGDDGHSHFEDVTVPGELREIVAGVPPVHVSDPHPAAALVFVQQPEDAADWERHVAPRRQWVVLLRGRFAATASDGERREFGPGAIVLAEDTEGEGHVSTPLDDDVFFVMIPTGT
jgi:hypothetical protein